MILKHTRRSQQKDTLRTSTTTLNNTRINHNFMIYQTKKSEQS